MPAPRAKAKPANAGGTKQSSFGGFKTAVAIGIAAVSIVAYFILNLVMGTEFFCEKGTRCRIKIHMLCVFT